MKSLLKFIGIVLLTGALLYVSCKKEYSSENCLESNKAPIANAGRDTLLVLPVDSINLDGSASSDPDGTISRFQWTKISGTASVIIISASAARTALKNLAVGAYQFELKITDNGGLSAKDTVQVIVNSQTPTSNSCTNIDRPLVNAQLIPVGSLSQARFWMGVASSGNKIVFAGGYSDEKLSPSSQVDIYDIISQKWSTAKLSVPRAEIRAVAVGNKIFFAGGEYYDPSDRSYDNPISVNVMDIYDVSANTWSVVPLIGGRTYSASAAAGNKIFFVEGSKVDIYDINTQQWSTSSLSDDRFNPSVVSANNKVYFAGGMMFQGSNIYGPIAMPVDKIDIYDVATDTWSVSSLVQGKIYSAGIAVAGKVYFAGGYTSNLNAPPFSTSCQLDIIDANTGDKSVQYLSRQWPFPGELVAISNKIVFLKGASPNSNSTDEFDIYDITTNTWSIGVLPLLQNISLWGASITSIDGSIYVSGTYDRYGNPSNQVWKLEF